MGYGPIEHFTDIEAWKLESGVIDFLILEWQYRLSIMLILIFK